MATKDKGWIKLSYAMKEWEWISCPEVVALWIALLINANYTDGNDCRRGQLRTSVRDLARITGLTERKVRTGLEKLRRTGEIGCIATQQNTLVTISKYEDYQRNNSRSDTPATHKTTHQTTHEVTHEVTHETMVVNSSASAQYEINFGGSDTPSDTPSDTRSDTQNDTLARVNTSIINNNKRNKEKKEYIKKESSLSFTKTPQNSPDFEKFQEWLLRNVPQVAAMQQPFTAAQFVKIHEAYNGEQVKEVLLRMGNYAGLAKKYVSAYLTARNWLRRDNTKKS